MNNKTEVSLTTKKSPIEQQTRYRRFEVHFYCEQNTVSLVFILWNRLLHKQSIKQEFPLIDG